jgi:hypothetical protein
VDHSESIQRAKSFFVCISFIVKFSVDSLAPLLRSVARRRSLLRSGLKGKQNDELLHL